MRVFLFNKRKGPGRLPSTSGALKLHIRRAHYQTTIWLNVTVPSQSTLIRKVVHGFETPTATSSLDKQRICVNTQLKSSKKQLKFNVCVPKSNSVDLYAITCDVKIKSLISIRQGTTNSTNVSPNHYFICMKSRFYIHLVTF